MRSRIPRERGGNIRHPGLHCRRNLAHPRLNRIQQRIHPALNRVNYARAFFFGFSDCLQAVLFCLRERRVRFPLAAVNACSCFALAATNASTKLGAASGCSVTGIFLGRISHSLLLVCHVNVYLRLSGVDLIVNIIRLLLHLSFYGCSGSYLRCPFGPRRRHGFVNFRIRNRLVSRSRRCVRLCRIGFSCCFYLCPICR